MSTTERTVLAYTKEGVEQVPDGRVKFATLAVARFDEAGKVIRQFRGNNITVELEEFMHLFSGDDPQLTLRGPDGMVLIVPGIKAAR